MPTRRNGARTSPGPGPSSDNRAVGSGGEVGVSDRRLLALTSSLRALTLRALNSPLVDRATFAHQQGLSFDGARDLYRVLGYDSKLTIAKYRARYERGGIAERIVEAYPRATWSGGAEIIENPDPGVSTPFETAIFNLFSRLDVWARLLRADILAGLGRYSIVLIGADGDLSTPLPRLSSPDAVLYLTTLAEDRATITKLVGDKNEVDATSDPRFGLPELYTVKLSDTVTRPVHWSRVIHIAEGCLEDEVYGKPRLRAVWNYLDDLAKIVGGGAEATWRRADPGMQLDLDPEMELSPDEEEELSAEVDEYIHGLRRVMRTRGAKANLLATQVASFGANADAVIQLISSTTGIPQRILTGSERGQLASVQDRNNWNDRVVERRREFAVPLIGQLLTRLIDHGALPKPSYYEVVWPEIDELDEAEKAEVAGKLALANKNQHESQGVVIISSNEIRANVLGLGPLEEIEEDLEDDPDVDPDEDEDPDGEEELDDDGEGGEDLRANAAGSDSGQHPDSYAIHRAASHHTRSLSRLLLSTWDEARDSLTRQSDALEAAIRGYNTIRAEQMVSAALRSAHEGLQEALPSRLLAVVADGGLGVLRAARGRGSWFRNAAEAAGATIAIPSVASGEGSLARHPDRSIALTASAQKSVSHEDSVCQSPIRDLRTATISTTFDSANPRAVSYSSARAASLVTEITPDTLAALRALLTAGISEGVSPRRLVQTLRQSVGLRSDQVAAVSRLAERLRTARPGTLIRAGKVAIRIPKSGVTTALIDKRTAEYAKRLLNQRALLISSTETLRSANEGAKELWVQAQEQGNLPADQKRRWLTSGDERVRPRHADMSGQVVGIRESFSPVSEPGSEPRCRCTSVLVR